MPLDKASSIVYDDYIKRKGGEMTQSKSEFRTRVDSMLPELMEAIRRETARLFESGAVDKGGYEDDFMLPKICLTVAIENQAHQYMPLSPEGKAEVKNLRHF